MLEFRRQPDFPAQGNQPASLEINVGVYEAGGRDQNRVFGLWVDKVAPLIQALLVIAGDTDDLAVALGHEVGRVWRAT